MGHFARRKYVNKEMSPQYWFAGQSDGFGAFDNNTPAIPNLSSRELTGRQTPR